MLTRRGRAFQPGLTAAFDGIARLTEQVTQARDDRVLTVGVGRPASHQGFGWEAITAAAIAGLAAREATPLVAILWGRHAQAAHELLPDVPVITSAHPSPMSADRGFFGSRPFSAANEALEDLGDAPINWQVE